MTVQRDRLYLKNSSPQFGEGECPSLDTICTNPYNFLVYTSVASESHGTGGKNWNAVCGVPKNHLNINVEVTLWGETYRRSPAYFQSWGIGRERHTNTRCCAVHCADLGHWRTSARAFLIECSAAHDRGYGWRSGTVRSEIYRSRHQMHAALIFRRLKGLKTKFSPVDSAQISASYFWFEKNRNAFSLRSFSGLWADIFKE